MCLITEKDERERQTDGQTRKEGTISFLVSLLVFFSSELRPVVPLSPAELAMLQLLFQH